MGPLLFRGELNVLNALLTLGKRTLENSCLANHLGRKSRIGSKKVKRNQERAEMKYFYGKSIKDKQKQKLFL